MSNVYRDLKLGECSDGEECSRAATALLDLLGFPTESRDEVDLRQSQCRVCGSKRVVGFGTDKNGKQRYRCKGCGRTFTETSYSAISRTRHNASAWEKYVRLFLAGAALEECSLQCNISIRTAFAWRHKILDVLGRDQSVGGESRETY